VDQGGAAFDVPQEVVPQALARLAPGIRPGTSAMTNWTSPASTTPRFGIKVVNG
jgi:hypothetical protein